MTVQVEIHLGGCSVLECLLFPVQKTIREVCVRVVDLGNAI